MSDASERLPRRAAGGADHVGVPMEIRIGECLRMLRKGKLSPAIQRVLSRKYNVSEREVRDWIRKACEILAAENRAAAPTLRDEALAVYDSLYEKCLKDGNLKHAIQVRSLRDRVSGALVFKIEATVEPEGPDLSKLTPAQLKAYGEKLAEARAIAEGPAALLTEGE